MNNTELRVLSYFICLSARKGAHAFRKMKKGFFMTENKYFDNLTFLVECSHLFYRSSPYGWGYVALSFLNKLKPASFFDCLIYAYMRVGSVFVLGVYTVNVPMYIYIYTQVMCVSINV